MLTDRQNIRREVVEFYVVSLWALSKISELIRQSTYHAGLHSVRIVKK